MDEMVDLSNLLKEDFPEPGLKEERQLLLFLLSLSEKDIGEEVLKEGERLYAPFIKMNFTSVSLSPFENDEDIDNLLLDSVKAFVLYTVGKEKAIPSLLLSFRYFLTAALR